MHCFDSRAMNRGPFGLTPPPPPPPPPPQLPLFGSAHHTPPGLYYAPFFAKFSQNHLAKEDLQEQVEPLSLIVGSQKKPKRTKVIDRVSPRAVKVTPVETGAQPGHRHPQQIRSDSPANAPAAVFHHRYLLHAGTAIHDAFPPHRSLLPFGLAPSSQHGVALALHNSSLHNHHHHHHHHSKFIESLYAQMSAVGQRTTDQGPGSPLGSTAAAAADMDDMDDDSKTIQKSIDYDAMTPHDAMMTMTTAGHNFTSTLTPMHLRKAKLMFFYVRYPSSSILKVYFPDVKFNKNNTAQLVKWFSNFREFYYIQMEKYARQALAEGVKNTKDIVVTSDSELHRILVVHYNRNCQIEVPENFRFVVQATLREFFTSIAVGKDQEPSWKKTIYKVIQRMDDPVPDYFKSPNWMERLVDG